MIRVKRRIVIVLLSLVLVGSIAGIGIVTYATLFGGNGSVLGAGPYVNPPPWTEGEPLTPVSTEGRPQLQSYARAQQTEDWMRSRMTLPGDGDPVQWSETLAFDETARERDGRKDTKIPAGLVAGQHVYVASAAGDEPRLSLDVWWFTSTDARDAYRDLRVPEEARQDGVSLVHKADTCTRGGHQGRLDTVSAYAPVGDRLLISTGGSCVPVDQVEEVKSQIRAAAEVAVQEAEPLEQEPMPTMLFDRTSDFPVISTGSWRDRQTEVDPSSDQQADRVFPDHLPRDGVELFIEGRDDVVVLATVDRAKSMINNEVTSSHPKSTIRQDVDYADEQVCRDGEHHQEDTQCWTRVGRIVVISRHDHDGEVQVKDQIELLRG